MARVEVDPSLEPMLAEKSLGELLSDLSREFTALLRTETDLAKHEIRHEATKAARAGAAFGAAAALGWLALVLLAFAAAWGLAEIVPEGFAFLIVGSVFAVAAAVLLAVARSRARTVNVVPPQTLRSVKEDVEWARQKTS